MTINLIFQCSWVVFAICVYLISQVPPKKRGIYDGSLFIIASTSLVAFSAFRPIGVGLDDAGGYASLEYQKACLDLVCGQWNPGRIDRAWYLIIGILKKAYQNPRIILLFAGFCLFVKLWIIGRLCNHKSLALLCYASIFYIPHDITALRVSLAVCIYLGAFYLFDSGRFILSSFLLITNGIFHQQAFFSPAIMVQQKINIRSKNICSALIVIPFLLLLVGLFPSPRFLAYINSSTDGVLFEIMGGFSSYRDQLKNATAEYHYISRYWPMVAPPTFLLIAYLVRDSFDDLVRISVISIHSLILAGILFWIYAVDHVMQLRFWYFYLVPMVFIFGNIHITRFKLISIIALCAIYVIKYTAIHDLLLDQGRVSLINPVGGQIIFKTPAIPLYEGNDFNVTKGTVANVQAIPDTGFIFSGWSGACNGSEPLCDILVSGDILIGAKFSEK